MNNFSYFILHYNRPFLLEINIRLVKKYAPNVQLIIADDGSDKRIFNKISKLPIDDMFVQDKKNINEWTNGTCSNTIIEGVKLVKNKFMLFSEDDFFFCPNPIDDSKMEQENYIIDLNYNNPPTFNIFEEAMNVMNNNPNVINVQMARDNSGWRKSDVQGEIKTDNMTWYYLNHKAKMHFYYANWPNMIRVSDFRQIPIPRNTAIWSFESGFSTEMDKHFGFNDWAVVPADKRRYLHVGMPFSKRLNKFAKSASKRSVVARHLQSLTMDKIIANDIEGFNKVLLQLWIEGKFFIDFDEMITNGLKKAMDSAFKRIK